MTRLYAHGEADYLSHVDSCGFITIDPDILGGTPVFKGTRVPIKTLFEYLADNLSLDYFLESFPSVSRELALAALHYSQQKIAHRATA